MSDTSWRLRATEALLRAIAAIWGRGQEFEEALAKAKAMTPEEFDREIQSALARTKEEK